MKIRCTIIMGSVLMIFLLLSLFVSGQGISTLKDDDEVFAFINKVFTNSYLDKTYKSHFKSSPLDTLYKYYKCDSPLLNLKVRQWEKVDFNSDHFMDLFVIVDEGGFKQPFFVPSVIINVNDTAWKIVSLSLFDCRCHIYYPFKIGRQQLLFSYKQNYATPFFDSMAMTIKYVEVTGIDTLIYKFDNFIEYNADSISPAIQSVSFGNSSCMLPCPQYKITIDKSKNITLDGYTNAKLSGNYRSIIAENSFREIFDLLQYINPKKLKDKYASSGTDAPTLYLEIKFTDGTVKEIEDYGGEGTNALALIYNYFKKIYKDQRWYK